MVPLSPGNGRLPADSQGRLSKQTDPTAKNSRGPPEAESELSSPVAATATTTDWGQRQWIDIYAECVLHFEQRKFEQFRLSATADDIVCSGITTSTVTTADCDCGLG